MKRRVEVGKMALHAIEVKRTGVVSGWGEEGLCLSKCRRPKRARIREGSRGKRDKS